MTATRVRGWQILEKDRFFGQFLIYVLSIAFLELKKSFSLISENMWKNIFKNEICIQKYFVRLICLPTTNQHIKNNQTVKGPILVLFSAWSNSKNIKYLKGKITQTSAPLTIFCRYHPRPNLKREFFHFETSVPEYAIPKGISKSISTPNNIFEGINLCQCCLKLPSLLLVYLK